MPPKSRLSKRTLSIAAIAGCTAIIIGAFGAHGLESALAESSMPAEKVAKRLAQFDTGARYHLAHAIVLLVLSAIPVQRSRCYNAAVGLMTAGILFFSGSLYLLVLTDTPWLGAVTPIGGACWIIGWFSMLFLAANADD